MTEANLQIIHDAYAAFGRGDVPGVLDLLTDDVRWSTPGPPDGKIAVFEGFEDSAKVVAAFSS